MSHFSVEQSMRLALVATKTEALIVEHGFVFAGHTFDLDESSQTKWLALRTLKPDLTFPLEISPRVGVYSLQAADLDAFLQAGLSVVMSYKSSGRSLRLSLEAASTMQDMIDIVDDRT